MSLRLKNKLLHQLQDIYLGIQEKKETLLFINLKISTFPQGKNVSIYR